MGKQRSLRPSSQDAYSPTNVKSSSSPPLSHSVNNSNSTSPTIVPNHPGTVPGRFERILPKYHHIPMVPQYAVPMVPAHPAFSYPYPLPTPMSGAYSRISDERQEKEILRKVSHSAIERRRRERINDKIFQLKTLVPSCANQVNLHKLSILESTIEYIHELQSRLSQVDESSNDIKKETPVLSSQLESKEDMGTSSPIFEDANNLLMLTGNATKTDADKYCYPDTNKDHSSRTSGMSVYDLLC
ncbi:helix-loop-helix DNA-binding protein [Basidiobolus meristosporus CBS 931.73]|uniref:Helix-loop-helix DNA-binding protein n=1 Tax=Basidiobolus meristosporus CBS 931.73 TaxID=1314790 RepID=A0A1Y1Z1K9_9FUNG|nr:helix-loop-helix DNA-binding protein [Basidiobolus meristosporus CBS 931.73]|eukprot:ORY04172.1 helix-loop-helix DNA-binding protein [Basidiobolus meristosporus CBS 931.73]